jgi:hypothetical protein
MLALDDLDGDGTRDLAVGLCGEFVPSGTGEVWCISGKDGHLLSSSKGGERAYDYGRRIVGVNDRDGDGRGDFVVCAPRVLVRNSQPIRPDLKSEASVVSSVTGKTLGVITHPGDDLWFGYTAAFLPRSGKEGTPAIMVASMAIRDDVLGGSVYACALTDGTIEYTSPAGLNLGSGLTCIGDIDGDGRDDWAAAATPQRLSAGRGLVALGSGKDGKVIRKLRKADVGPK